MSRLRASALRFVGAFSPDLYISASLSLLLFSYTQVAAASLSYLACVDVGGVSVVFSQPAMRCASAEYRTTLVLVILALAVYVAGFPLAVLLFLWRRSDLVRQSHALIASRANAKAMAANKAAAGGDAGAGAGDDVDADGGVDVGSVADLDVHGSGSAALPAAAAAHFLRRYSPLFSMYSSSTWFWQVFVLVRRTVFVAVSVMLVRSQSDRGAAFVIIHLASLLVQLHFRPFQASFFNGAETFFLVLLILLSTALSVRPSPRPTGTEILLFLLVVPPLAVYAVAAIMNKYFGVRARRAQAFADRLAEQQRVEETQWGRGSVARAGEVNVQLSSRSPSVALSPSKSVAPTAALSAPDSALRSDDECVQEGATSSSQAL